MKITLAFFLALFLCPDVLAAPDARPTPSTNVRQTGPAPRQAAAARPRPRPRGAAKTKKPDAPKKVTFGLYILHIFDLDFVKNQYKIQFWSWFHKGDDKYKPNKTTELMNARKFSRHLANEELVKGIHWDTAVIKAEVKQRWKVRRFPFDKQELELHLEDVNLPKEKLLLIPDVKASKIDPGALPQGWKLVGFKIRKGIHKYQTAFGDPAAKSGTQQSFSRLTVTIALQRQGWRLFFTTFTGFFVASILVLIVFMLNSFPKIISLITLAANLSLCTGALFAAVGGIYLLSSRISYTTEFTFADSILITSLTGIALAIAGAVLAEVLQNMEKVQLAVTINRVLLTGYLLMWALFPAWIFYG